MKWSVTEFDDRSNPGVQTLDFLSATTETRIQWQLTACFIY